MKINDKYFIFLVALLPWFLPFVVGYGSFPVKYKGNYVSLEEYEKLELCGNKWCLHDANRILEEISYNDTVEPCEDFNDFVCGTFFKERALNERYEYIGFRRNFELKLDEERHRALKEPVDEKDGKVTKVTKNFYQRCINSRHIEKKSRQEVLNYMSTFGKFPIQKPDWTEADLNFTKLLTETKLEYFFNFEVAFSPSPSDGTEMLSIISEHFHSWVRYVSDDLTSLAKDIIDMYELLKFPTDGIENLISNFNEASLKYSLAGRSEETFNGINSENFIGSIEDLSNNLTQFEANVSWIDIINSQLVEGIRAKEETVVFVWDFTEFKNRLEIFKTMDKRMIANAIMIDILYDYRDLFQVYGFKNTKFKKAIKTPQRFEICNSLLEKVIPIAPRAIFARRYFTDEDKKAAKLIMNIAISSHLNEITKLNTTTPEYVTRIKNVQPIAGYPNDMTADSFLDRIYVNLSLAGNESLIETFRKLERYQKFIDFMDHADEDFVTLNVDKTIGNTAFSCTFATDDFLYCPATALRYPVFHPQRSQFYNMAMLLPEIYQTLGLSWDIVDTAEDKAFRDYQKWVKMNGVEASIPGFLLSNEQMFWVALKLKTCVKGELEFQYTKVFSTSGFQEAFDCLALNKSQLCIEWCHDQY